MEATVQQLINLAQNTSELYHELHALDRFEQDFKRKFRDEESVPAARRESIMILHSELKRQRKLVKNLKKKSLWSRTLEEIVEKLVDIVIFLHKQIRDSFNETGTDFCASEQTQNKRLGSCGLALHYANIINQIENIVSRPLSLPPSARDNLYHGLPITVKSALRSRLQTYNPEEERTVAQIKAEMQKTLRWLLPIAENTIRAHQGFGWVGEWANLGHEQEIRLPAQRHPHPDAPSRRQGENRALHAGAGGAPPPPGDPGEEQRLRDQQIVEARRVVPVPQGGGNGPPTGDGDSAQHVAGEQPHGLEPAVGLRARGAGPPELQEDGLRQEPELRASAWPPTEQGPQELGPVPEPRQLPGDGVRQDPRRAAARPGQGS
ncbi:Receptor-like protein kinase-like [Zea mays]|uniref:Receptor-like protein kinase-like n=1 Tax=Zea mays TaxID=4577 RepID=A0A1D6GWD6_MAIZE|nr:Receptor-like protein kinase-like [Zea mays]